MDGPKLIQTPLTVLLEDVLLARAVLRQERTVSSGRSAVRAAQQDLLDSLTAYGDALASRGLPLPPAMHDEIRLYGNVVRAY